MAFTDIIRANRSGVAFALRATNISLPISSSVTGYLRGISLGGPTSQEGDDGYGARHLQTAITRSYVEGNPSTPCLELTTNGIFRFRWVVKAGLRSVSVLTKQIKIFNAVSRPSITIKANSNIGLNADLTSYAPISSDWITIGPVSFTSTGIDATWVELRNNLMMDNAPAYFDHIVVT